MSRECPMCITDLTEDEFGFNQTLCNGCLCNPFLFDDDSSTSFRFNLDGDWASAHPTIKARFQNEASYRKHIEFYKPIPPLPQNLSTYDPHYSNVAKLFYIPSEYSPLIQELRFIELNYSPAPTSPPAMVPDLCDAICITVGDLHANPRTLIDILIMCGVIKIEVIHYHQLMTIIEHVNSGDLLTPAMFLEFFTIFNLCKFNALNRPRRIRLLGDIIADRMGHEAIMFVIIGFIRNPKHVPSLSLIIIYSNHDSYLQEWMTGRNNIHEPTSLSLARFKYFLSLIESPAVSNRDRLYMKMILCTGMRSYIKCLCFFDFENILCSQATEKAISIFSHAPIHPSLTYYALCLVSSHGNTPLNPPPKWPRVVSAPHSLADIPPPTLINLIKSANDAIKHILESILNFWILCVIDGNLHLQIPDNTKKKYLGLFNPGDGTLWQPPSPAYLTLWRRQSLSLLKPQPSFASYISFLFPLPKLLDGTQITNIHGHDLTQRPSLGYTSLDNLVGKGTLEPKEDPQKKLGILISSLPTTKNRTSSVSRPNTDTRTRSRSV